MSPNRQRQRTLDSEHPPRTASATTVRARPNSAKTRHSQASGRLPDHEAWLFDAERTDHSVELTATSIATLKDRQLLWIDVRDDPTSEAVAALLGSLPIDAKVAQETRASVGRPRLKVAGPYFQLHVVAMNTDKAKDDPATLEMIAGANFVVTIHKEPITALDDLVSRIDRDTVVGRLDSGTFVAVLLDGLMTNYLELSDELEATVDRLDEQALKSDGRVDLLGEMVKLRHRIAAVRRTLVAHREVVGALARADFEAIAGTSAAEYFRALAERFQHAVDSVDGSRESLVGTFDIHMTRTSQRTNQIMKILTIVSVTLLPAGVIAGFMGMNEAPPYAIDDPRVFWIVVAVIATIAAITFVALRVRRWI